ncbi:hypothetical protein STEG23_001663, partial [Scotinomys teguina]
MLHLFSVLQLGENIPLPTELKCTGAPGFWCQKELALVLEWVTSGILVSMFLSQNKMQMFSRIFFNLR